MYGEERKNQTLSMINMFQVGIKQQVCEFLYWGIEYPFNPASVLKNNPKIVTAIKLTNTRFNTSSKSFTLKALKRQDKNDIFLRNSGGRFSRPVLLSVQNIIYVISKNASWVTILKGSVLRIEESRL